MGMAAIIIFINFHSLVPKTLDIKFGQNCPVASEKRQVLIFTCKLPWAKVMKWPSDF